MSRALPELENCGCGGEAEGALVSNEFWIQCSKCGMSTGLHPELIEAKAVWNAAFAPAKSHAVLQGHAKSCPAFGMFQAGPCDCGWQRVRDLMEQK